MNCPRRKALGDEAVQALGEYLRLNAVIVGTDIADFAAALRGAAGNFYMNDKPTAAVVGQQPFGGGRASGTNDKAGSAMNLLRWMSVRTLKETFDPPKDWRYPFMGEE